MRKFLLFLVAVLFSISGIGQTVFTQNFDAAWTIPSSLSPAWSGTATPADNQWQRDDYTTGWASTYGSYTPAGANSTLHSARFHSYDAGSGTSGDFITPVINLSAYTAGLVVVKFYYINTSGTDVLNIYSSNDGGTTWSTALRTALGVAATWTEYTTTLPGNSATTKIKLTATSDYGTTDIGVDEFRVMNPVIPAPPISFTATLVSQGSMTIGWTDNSTNETGFRVYKSTDQVTYTQVGTDIASTSIPTTGTLYSQPATGLMAGITYYFRVVSYTDAESSYLTGSQATLPPVPRCGTKSVGPTGDYLSLTDAFSDLSTNGVSCAVNLVLQAAYLSTVETFPIAVNSIAGVSVVNTVTVYPSTSGLSITSNNTTGTINLNGVNYVYLDGRVNATGSTKDLVIENSSTTGYAVQLVNGASYNGFRYCIVKGACSSYSNGTFTFASTTAASGNNNNLIDNCEIRNGVSSPMQAIYSAGSASPALYNSNNTVSNCLIHDFYSPTGGNPLGIGLFGSTAWTISGNSFYMVNVQNPTTAIVGFVIYLGSGDGYTITNNFIGGSAPNCGGSPWTLNGNGTPPTLANSFYGIDFATGGLTVNPSSVQGNTISNISLFTNSAAAGSIKFVGLLSLVGIQNIGNITPNIIGSAAGTGSITISVGNGAYTSYYEGIDFRGMYGNVMNNTFGSFTISGPAGSTNANAIYVAPISVTPTVQNGAASVSGNLVGSLITPNSIQTPAMTFPPAVIRGIYVASTGSGTMSVANNTVANITNLSSHTTSYMHGIYSGGAGLPNVVSGNTIRDLTTTSTNTTIAGSSSIVGIYSANSVPGSTIRSNTIYNLTNTSTTAAVGINGLLLNNTAGSLLVEKNFIHNIGLSTSSSTAQVNGMYLANGSAYATIKNNMIQLGINPDGSANTSSCSINGLYEAQLSTVDSILNNSVYIGGAAAAAVATGATYAFNGGIAHTLAAPLVCLDNIFFNARSGGITNKHYGIKQTGTLYNPVGVTSNYNLIIANGATGGTFGYYNLADQATFAAYKGATGTEMASGNSDPNFIAPTGTGATANLHVQNPTPIEAAGIALANVTDDFDGAARSGLTPPDIGADAGNFTLSADVNGPNITYVPIGNGIVAATRVVSNWATITDNVGVSTGASLPRIYYKKLTDANAFVGNTSANNGWKYVVASNTTSPFSFTIDYSLLQAPVAAADIIQYFVVAQDAANNLSSGVLLAGSSATPPVQNINAAPTIGNIQQYSIVSGSIPTTITVPGTYPTLTGTNGAFDMINKGVLTGNTIINITADLVEPGTVALNAWAEDPPGSNYTLKIQPDASSLRTISGTAVAVGTAMIRTNAASRFTIDGGASKLLTFRNTNSTAASTGPTIQYNGGSVACYLKNSTIENNGSTTTYGAVNIGSTGVNSVEISGNDIRDATAGTTGRFATGIYNGTFTNTLRVLNNNIFNFINYGLYFSTVADGTVITGNSFYYNSATASTATQYCIYLLGSSNNHTISGNFFGGSSPSCGGTAWTNSTTNTIYGIYATLGIASPSTLANNTIQNFNLSNVGSASFYGIYVTAGVVNFQNNILGSSSTLSSITSAGTGSLYGFYLTPSATAPSYIQGNTVSGISYTNTSNSGTFYFIYLTTGLFKVGTTSPNIVGSSTTAGSISYAGTGTLYGIYCSSANPGNAIENNIIGNWSLVGTSGSPSVRGMYIYSANVKKNKIFNISCANAGLTPSLYGIYNYGASGVTNEYSNNLISLNAGAATNPTIYGFYDNSYASAFFNLYFNDFNISGPATGTSTTYAFYRGVAAFYTLSNNIFANTRVAGGTGKHYALYVSSTGVWSSNYNDIYSVAGPLGYYNAADQLTMSAWKAASAGDANSVNVDPQFVSASDLHTCQPAFNGAGIAVSGVTTDYAGVTRGNPPDIGAYEFSIPVPSITGPTPVCVNIGGNTYTTEAGMTGYSWVVINGSITAGGTTTDNYVTVTFTGSGAHSVSVNYFNANGCSASTPTVKSVTVHAEAVGGTILGSTNVCTGTNSTLLTISGATGTVIKWQYSIDNWVTPIDIANTSNTYTASNLTTTTKYRAVLGNGVCPTATSSDATVTVDPVTVGGSIAGSATVCSGTNSTLLTLSGHTGAVVKWQSSTDNWVTPVDIVNTAATYTATNLTTTTKFRAVVQSGACSSANSTDATVTVDPVSVGGLIAGSATVCSGTNSTLLSLSGYTGTITKWQKSTDNWVTPVDIANTTNTYTATNLATTTKYRAVITSGVCSSANSAEATVTVDPVSVGGTIAGSTTVCTGTNSTLLTLSGYTGSITKWQYSVDNWVTPIDIVNTTNTYTATNLTNSTKYRAVITSGVCSSTNSAEAQILVNVASVGGSIAGSAAVCSGTNSTLLTLSGQTGAIVKWQYSTDNWVTPVDIVNTTTTYTATNLTTTTKYRAVVQSGVCSSANSSVATVTVNPLPVPTVSGPATCISGTSGNVYTTEAAMTGYAWTISAGGTIDLGQGTNSISVTWSGAGAQSVSVTYTNGNSCSAAAPTVYPVSVTAIPGPAGPITGTATVCQGQSGVAYSIAAVVNATSYVWTLPTGASIATGSGTNSITVNYSGTAVSGNINVYGANGLGNGAVSPNYAVTVKTMPNPTISGTNTLCAGTTGVVYTTEASMTGYTWTVSTGGTITAGAGTNAITVTWSTAGAKTVTVNYTNSNGCPAPTPTSYPVTVNPVPVPTIAGPASVCAGATGSTYTTETGMTGYTWTVSAGGTIVVAAGNTAVITWNTAGAQWVKVNYANGSGCTAATATQYDVTVNALPVPAITGTASVCVGSTGNVYTTATGMTNYLWSVSPGGTVTAGGLSTNNTVTVTWTTAGAQWVKVNYTNASGCTASAQTQYNVTVNPLPVPTITGTASSCVGSTGNIYSTEASMTGYTWVISAGGTITAGAGTNTVTVTWGTAGAQTLSVNYVNGNGCTATSSTVKNVTVSTLPVPTITGSASVCVGSTGNVYSTEAAMTGYSWVISAGGTITAGAGTSTVTVTWNTAGAQTLSVNYNNAGGCAASSATVKNVTVNTLPVPTITGPASACVSSTGNVYTTQAGMTGYTWVISAGGTITAGAGTSSVTVTWNTVGARTISVNYANANGCTASTATIYNVTVNALPVPTITGPTAMCANTSGNVYTTQTGMTGYTWAVTGGTITAGAGTSSITVTWTTAGAQTVSVNYNNASGCAALAPTIYNVTVNPLPTPVISGPALVCVNSTGNMYTTLTGMTNYVWTVSAGGTVTAGGTATSNFVTVTWTTSGAKTVSVNYANAFGCVAGAATVYNVTVNALPVPTITGPTDICANAGYPMYSTEAGMSGYTWSVSPGGLITAGQGTSYINVFWGTAGTQWVKVTYTNTSGCSASTPTQLNVNVNGTPGAAGAITGTAAVCAGATGVSYSVAPVTGALAYSWTLPTGATIVSGQYTNSITVDFAANATSGPITVAGNNLCGDGQLSPAYQVTVNGLPAAAGAITGTVNVCQGEDGVAYSVGAITNATGYTWTLPTGATIASGANTNSITVDFSITAASGTVKVFGTNSCGVGTVSPSFAVTVNAIPSTPTVTASGNTLTSSAASGNQWYWNGSAVSGATSQVYNVPVGNPGNYWTIVTLNGCMSDSSNHVYVAGVGVQENENLSFNVYPVPNNGVFTAEVSSSYAEDFRIQIYNTLGAMVYKTDDFRVNGTHKEQIDVHQLPAGIYSVVFMNDQRKVVRKVFINK